MIEISSLAGTKTMTLYTPVNKSMQRRGNAHRDSNSRRGAQGYPDVGDRVVRKRGSLLSYLSTCVSFSHKATLTSMLWMSPSADCLFMHQ